jgi:hypothetical protein
MIDFSETTPCCDGKVGLKSPWQKLFSSALVKTNRCNAVHRAANYRVA